MKSTFLLCFLLAISYLSIGQMLHSDSTAIGGKVSIGGNINEGNLQKMSLVNTANFFYNTIGGKFGLESHTQYIYTKTFGQVQENDVLTRTLFYNKLYNRWYTTVVFWYETNKLRQMHPLVQGGPSLEYAWLLKKGNTSGISLGATYEHKHFDTNTFSEAKYNGNQKYNNLTAFYTAAWPK